MNAIAAAVVARMQADTDPGGLNAADGSGALGGFHRGKAPEGATFPRIHFQFLTALPSYVTVGEAFRKIFVQLTVYSIDPPNGGEEGMATASRLNERTQALFTDPADMTITGHDLLFCRPQRELPSGTERDDDNQRDIYSEGCVIEIWTAKV